MFDGNVTNQFPHSVADCNREDPVAASLWKWAIVIETIGKVLLILDIVVGLIASIALFEETNGVSLAIIPAAALFGAIVYLTFRFTALIIGSLGKITQNTTVSSKADLFRMNATLFSNASGSRPKQAEKYESVTNVSSGFDPVFLGKYPQSNTSNNESIIWEVLSVDGDKALIISKYALDCKPYNDKLTEITWETCSLRKWLNGEFLNKAFSEKEKEKILITEVASEPNPYYDTPAGNLTEDKIFLLSINQTYEYYANDSERRCKATEYARMCGANTTNDYCWWWSRSPGDDPQGAAGLNEKGSIVEEGWFCNVLGLAVRPAMWIKLD